MAILLVPRKQSQEKKSLKKNVLKFPLLKHPRPLLQTCGEDHLLGDEFIIYNGELRKLDLRHPGDCVIITAPVKLNVIRCISICKRKRT